MKRIFSVFIVALAGTVTTAYAANYYDTYANPKVETSTSYEWRADWNTNVTYQHETVSYENYQIVKTSYFNQGLDHDSFYKIRITGDNVDLYISDYLDNIQDSNNVDALTRKGITKIGYRYLALGGTESDNVKDANRVVGRTVTMGLTPDSNRTENYTFGQDKQNNGENVIIDEKDPDRYDNKHVVTRNHYYLGTFQAGDEIEIYMKADNMGEAWSNTDGYVGGYGSGVTDAWDRLAAYQLGLDSNAVRSAAPLASICVNGYSQRVFYGLYSEGGSDTFGAPLPGGLPIILISGLFALGFWYVRRRKTVSA